MCVQTIFTSAKLNHLQFRLWRESGILSSIIPLLTFSIVFGWLLTVGSLTYAGSGIFKGVVGASAVFALAFGILGQSRHIDCWEFTDDLEKV